MKNSKNSKKSRSSNTSRGPWLVALANAMRASDAPMRSRVLTAFPTFFVVFIDHMISLVVTIPMFLREWRQILKFKWNDWASLIAISLGSSVLGLLFFTQSFATTSNYTVPILIQKLQPIIAILLAVMILKEKLTKRFWLWALLGIIGAYFVSFGFAFTLGALAKAELMPVMFALLAAVFWGSGTVFGKHLTNRYSYSFVTAIRYLASVIFLIIMMLFLNQWGYFGQLNWTFFLLFVGIAFIPGFIPLLIYYLGLRECRASVATIAELAFPLSAILVNRFFLGDTLSIGQVFGTIVLLGSITMLSIENANKE
ncbi:DMT family transporter [Candidatus Woesearchaeota archaeon]|nr:DMT family transporter [Candidatus Woesearchaeota archaeon]